MVEPSVAAGATGCAVLAPGFVLVLVARFTVIWVDESAFLIVWMFMVSVLAGFNA
jgi:hypothetical protein